MESEKQIMFQNRLQKVWKHISKTAKRQELACFRFYDHDLPEFPFAIDWYNGIIHAAEYKRRHGMEDDEHTVWLETCKDSLALILNIDKKDIFMKVLQRKAGRQGQYEKFDEQKIEKIVHEGG